MTATSVIKAYLQRVETKLRIPIRHARKTRKKNESLLVCLEDEQGHRGYGECLPRDYVTGETVEGAAEQIRSRWIPAIRDQRWEDSDPYSLLLPLYQEASQAESLAAYGAVDMALYDLLCQRQKISLATLLGRQSELRIRSMVIPLGWPIGLCVAILRIAGVRDVKIKVASTTDLESLPQSNVRMRIRVDANNAFTPLDLEGRTLLPAMIEEPFARGDWASMAALQSRGTTVIADDSLCTSADAKACLAAKAASVWNLRLGKNGGITGVRALHALAIQHDISCGFGVLVGESPALTKPHRELARHLSFDYIEQGFAGLLLAGNPVKRIDYQQSLLPG